jgi:hypothetical protein
MQVVSPDLESVSSEQFQYDTIDGTQQKHEKFASFLNSVFNISHNQTKNICYI